MKRQDISTDQQPVSEESSQINSNSSSFLQIPHDCGAGGRYFSQPLSRSWSSQDPRSSSTQSLVPVESQSQKRTLLLIYIHGFLGNETSFRSFPAHVHNVLTVNLAKTHVVHTKIYPRYKSRKAIEYARDDFSHWLHPHDSPNTDTILLGHSMGGLLAAEVALLSSSFGRSRHRILGTIAFDCPFLGIHPDVVISGISSLFRPALDSPSTSTPNLHPRTQEMPTNIHSQSLYSPGLSASAAVEQQISQKNNVSSPLSQANLQALYLTKSDSSCPNYNLPFPNDVRLPIRTGWANAFHFVTKHLNELPKATSSYITSHLEFGGCLADYRGLRNRYAKIRALENYHSQPGNSSRRVRFVNYYTASPGRPKKPTVLLKKKSEWNITREFTPGPAGAETLEETGLSNHSTPSPARTPEPSIEAFGNQFQNITLNSQMEITAMKDKKEKEVTSTSCLKNLEDDIQLPPLPPFPRAPLQFDPAAYSDRPARNLAHKEYTRQSQIYFRDLRAYNKAVHKREKYIEKKEAMEAKASNRTTAAKLKHKSSRSQSSNGGVDQNGDQLARDGALAKRPRADSSSSSDNNGDASAKRGTGTQPPKEKRFCVLPSRDADGKFDETCWVRVFIPDVDPVGAHCGLFLVWNHYAWLVGDVAERVQRWVEEMDG